MKKISLIAVLLSMVFLTGCVRKLCVEGIKSGLVESASASASIEGYVNDVNIVIEKGGGAKSALITVGHQLGNYIDYPKFPGCIKDREFTASVQMDYSFNNFGLTGVEADVQLGPDKNTVYIVHERLTDKYSSVDGKWNDVKGFYDKNTLKLLLAGFIKFGDRYLYIELKAKRAGTADREEIDTVLKMLDVIREVLPAGDKGASVRSRIGFISFNYTLLKKVIEERARKSELKPHKLYYIACSNKTIGKGAACLCPELNDPDNFLVAEREKSKEKGLWDTVNDTNELAGIWLSPADIDDAVVKLSRINVKRVEGNLKPLEYFLSTYQKKREAFFSLLNDEKSLKGNSGFYSQIKGLVFDIKK